MRDATKGLLAVCVGFGALAVAVGAWVTPSSLFRPTPPENTTEPGMQVLTRPSDRASGDGANAQTDERLNEWDALAAKLDRFRPRTAVVEERPGPGPDDDDDQPTPPGWTPAWVYEGFVASEERPAALVRIGGVQRFVFAGDQVMDPTTGSSDTIRVDSINADEIRVSLNGRDGVVERLRGASGPLQTRPGTPNQRPGVIVPNGNTTRRNTGGAA